MNPTVAGEEGPDMPSAFFPRNVVFLPNPGRTMPRPGFFLSRLPGQPPFAGPSGSPRERPGRQQPLGTARPLGDEEPSPRFWEQLTLQGLFGTPRLLVVRQAHLWPAAVWKRSPPPWPGPRNSAGPSSVWKCPGKKASPRSRPTSPSCAAWALPTSRAGSGAAKA